MKVALFPEFEIVPIEPDSLPVTIGGVSLKTVLLPFLPAVPRGNLEALAVVRHDAKICTYLTYFDISGRLGLDQGEEIDAIDFGYEQILGETAIDHYFKLTTDEKDRPSVCNTGTAMAYQRQGLGSRRLRILNQVTQKRYGLPLFSDTCRTISADKTWDRLVREGLAVKFFDLDKPRYRFLTPDELFSGVPAKINEKPQ